MDQTTVQRSAPSMTSGPLLASVFDELHHEQDLTPLEIEACCSPV